VVYLVLIKLINLSKGRIVLKKINNKLIQNLIIILQILYILLFFTTSIINDIYYTFWASVIISIISLISSMINVINKDNFRVLFILISIAEILFTVFIYLIPEAGIPAPIKLF
jgi:hypothetical protein